MALYDKANVFERLNAGVYAPLVGVAKPMVEAVMNIDPSFKAGQGINVATDGTATLATDNATHVVVGSNLGLTDGTFTLTDLPQNIQAVPLNQALVDCLALATETIAVGDEVAFANGVLVAATVETQKFIAKDVEAVSEQGVDVLQVRIEFKA